MEGDGSRRRVSLPDDLVVEEILRRLPAKSVIRAGAVCRFYRTGTRMPGFLSKFYEMKPALPLSEFRSAGSEALETLDILAGAECRRRVLGFDWHRVLHLHASCDGLLLLSYTSNGRYLICNPATRESLSLPLLNGGECLGLYSSSSAGGGREYRVLFWKGRPGAAKYYVLTVGSSAQPRPVVLPDAPHDFRQAIRGGVWARYRPAALFQEALHFVPGSCTEGTKQKVLVFDTTQESFRFVRSPVAIEAKSNPAAARLYVMDDTLCMSVLQHVGMSTVTTWALRDYHHEIWEEKQHVTLTKDCSDHLVLSNKGELLLYFSSRVPRLIRSDSEGNVLHEFHLGSSMAPARITGHWFKENIVEHTFFKRRLRKQPPPPFFHGI